MNDDIEITNEALGRNLYDLLNLAHSAAARIALNAGRASEEEPFDVDGALEDATHIEDACRAAKRVALAIQTGHPLGEIEQLFCGDPSETTKVKQQD